MKKWQKERNYRKYKNEDGSFRYVITVDDEDVWVTQEVYQAYSQADRRERYSYERGRGLILSLDRLVEDGMHLSYLTEHYTESVEDVAIRNVLCASAMDILKSLPLEDQLLIQALVIDGMTEKDYAQQIGLSQKGVNKQKHKILKNIYKILVLKPLAFREG